MNAHLQVGFNYNMLETSYDFSYQTTTIETNWHIFHCHEGMEFLYVHEGNGYAIINQKMIEIRPQTLVYFQPFQLHGTKVSLDQNAAYTRSILSFEPFEIEAYLQHFPALKAFFQQIWKADLPVQVLSQLPVNNPIEVMFKHYQHLSQADSYPDRQEEFSLFIIGFLNYLKSVWPACEQLVTQSASTPPSYIERIMDWIEENYTSEFQLNVLSDELHLTSYYISHLFQQWTGTTITQYVIARRMRQACWLLKNSAISVYEICQQIGLTNVSYFCKKFKEYSGRTPLQYRNDSSKQQHI
ncbi:AraC family transcriptional regulator [Paenibacillus roseipurpureus]|uniref:AraC family transcriptional regulator n=1 Tax=Paenibacillus roseopurpureus TaxID=2918901 RepID=A0AA96LKN2_9BACL|nr:AraC family transcriptional regulator [Paenibacillus sp. MBLB1832]WNR42852.1 AraC family transcriptional regulator [Paenibacillus sp. MBLB1832]